MTVPASRAAGTTACEGVLFRLHAQRCGSPVEAVCTLWSAEGALELRLEVGGAVQRSEPCGSQDAALDTADVWRSAMVDRGWR